MTDKQTSAPRGVSRRAVAKGVAWATPVVAVAAVAPTASASPLPPLYLTGNACKRPNFDPKRYYFQLSIAAGIAASSVPFTFVWEGTGALTYTAQNPGADTAGTTSTGTVNIPAEVAANGGNIVLMFTNAEDASNGKLTINYTIGGQDYSTSVVDNAFSGNCTQKGIEPF